VHDFVTLLLANLPEDAADLVAWMASARRDLFGKTPAEWAVVSGARPYPAASSAVLAGVL
jgi:hypothetical protein